MYDGTDDGKERGGSSHAVRVVKLEAALKGAKEKCASLRTALRREEIRSARFKAALKKLKKKHYNEDSDDTSSGWDNGGKTEGGPGIAVVIVGHVW